MNNLEIHALVCKRDIVMALNNFKSLHRFEEFSGVPVHLHDDGSLDENDREILSEIRGVSFIGRDYADSEIKKYIGEYPNCTSYRLGKSDINLWHKIKLFDYFFFSKTKKILGMDADLLFMRKPKDVIEKIHSGIPFYFPDCQSSYCFNEPKDIGVPPKVNTGLIFIPSEENYDIDSIEFALKNLVGNGINYFPSWIEQSAFAHMFFNDGRYVSLDEEKYRIPYFQDVNISAAECLHFVSYPAVRDTYQGYLDHLDISFGRLVYYKEFLVDFMSQKIPLKVKVLERSGMLGFEFAWCLEKTTQAFLDHSFRINFGNKETEHHFQSHKNGFFVEKSEQKKFDIFHSYDWYGEKNWVKLDEVTIV